MAYKVYNDGSFFFLQEHVSLQIVVNNAFFIDSYRPFLKRVMSIQFEQEIAEHSVH